MNSRVFDKKNNTSLLLTVSTYSQSSRQLHAKFIGNKRHQFISWDICKTLKEKKQEIIYSNNHNLSEFKTQTKSGKSRVDCLVRGEHQATKGKRPLTTEDQGTQAMTIIITTISSRVNKMTIIMIVIVISVTRLLGVRLSPKGKHRFPFVH